MKELVLNIRQSQVGKLISSFKKTLLEDEQAKFRLLTTFKIISVSFLTLVIQALVVWLILQLDVIFFKAHNISGIREFESIFFDYIMGRIYDYGWEITIFLLFVTIVGMYISKLIMRPFKSIGNYCENAIKSDVEASYDPDFFTDLKILTRFSEYFFLQIDNAFKNKELKPADVPKKYKGIYKPKFEYSFFLQFFFILLIISTISSFGVYALTSNIYESIVSLATETIVLDDKTQRFFSGQENLFKNVSLILMVIHTFLYMLLSMHLYKLVASPAFAIFATMRSFLRGNYKARVHLIGNYYARPETKKLNKFLDHAEKNLVLNSKDEN